MSSERFGHMTDQDLIELAAKLLDSNETSDVQFRSDIRDELTRRAKIRRLELDDAPKEPTP